MGIELIIREGKYMQYPGKELSLEEKKQRLYHYTSFNSFVKIWLTKTLKFGNIMDMNDIFESNFSSQCHSIKDMEYMNLYHEGKNTTSKSVLQWTMILSYKDVCHQ